MHRNGYRKKNKGTRETQTLYHWLDNGNNKKALQEAEKVLKKQPNLQCARVLKCLALLRLGREADCMELLESVRKEMPVEDATLQAMTVCYREIHKPHLICDLYKWAHEKDPSNEELLIQLFMSYVRIADYNKQQQTAMLLFKQTSKRQYCFWAVMSILLQGTDTHQELLYFCLPPLYRGKTALGKCPDKPVKDVRFKLAEKMVEKFLDNIDTEQEIELYLVILKMQNKLQEAVTVLDGSLGRRLQRYTVLNHKVSLLIKLERWAEANLILRSMISENPDHWDYTMYYFETAFQLINFSNKDRVGECKWLQEVKIFIQGLVQQNKDMGWHKRGPILAQLELYVQLERRGLPAHTIVGDMVELIMSYMREFGDTECCLRDLRPYLSVLSKEEAKDLLNRVWTFVGLEEGDLPKDKKQMNLHISNIELTRGLDIPHSPTLDQRTQLVMSILQYYIHAQNFNNDLLNTETRSSDRYALLIAHVIYHMYLDSKENNYLYEAIVICHYALTYSPSNSQLKLLLLKFYHMLGGVQGAHNAYVSLDIKHMQLDSLGYLHVFPLIAGGHYSGASGVLATTLKFFSNNYKDSADHIIFSYKCDAFTKIPEFIDIREKLNNSIHYMQAILEKMLLDIFHCSSHPITNQIVNDMEVTPNLDKVHWNKIQDNRDFNVLWELEPRLVTKAVIEQSHNHDIVLLRVRALLLRIIVAVLQLARNDSGVNAAAQPNNNNNVEADDNASENNGDAKTTLINLMDTMEAVLEELKANAPNSVGRRYVAGPPDSRLILLLQCNYFSVVLDQLYFFMEMLPGDGGTADKAHSRLDSLLLYFGIFSDYIAEEDREGDGTDNFSRLVSLTQMAAVYVELVSFALIITGSVDQFIKRLKQAMAKKSKKKKENINNPPPDLAAEIEWMSDVYTRFTNALSENITTVEAVLSRTEQAMNTKNRNLGELIIAPRLGNKKEREKIMNLGASVNETFASGYALSLNQMSTALKLKLKYLSMSKH